MLWHTKDVAWSSDQPCVRKQTSTQVPKARADGLTSDGMSSAMRVFGSNLSRLHRPPGIGRLTCGRFNMLSWKESQWRQPSVTIVFKFSEVCPMCADFNSGQVVVCLHHTKNIMWCLSAEILTRTHRHVSGELETMTSFCQNCCQYHSSRCGCKG